MIDQNEEIKIIIAIDGFSSCGKSTLAKALAQKLGYTYIDTGAMYRAASLYFLEQKIDTDNQSEIEKALKEIKIEINRSDQGMITLLNGKNVEDEIRSMRISNVVSEISAIPEVRKNIVAQQQLMGARKGIVMEGRDIGTVVFPEAEIKIFLTASPQIRVQRRYLELKNKGKNMTLQQVRKNLEKRDLLDSTRSHSPLRKAEDAIEIDNSQLSIDDQVDMILDLIQVKLLKTNTDL